MGVENWSAARYWDGTEAASIRLASKALTASVSAVTVPKFASEAARDTAAAAWVAEGGGHTLQGLTCYVSSRAGTCFHDGVKWRWHSLSTVLYDGSGMGADVHGVSPTILVDPPSITLPPGNRMIQISASVTAMPITLPTDSVPRMLIEGNGYSRISQQFTPASIPTTLFFFDYAVFNGYVDLRMQCFNVFNGGWVRFGSPTMTLIDCGPTSM